MVNRLWSILTRYTLLTLGAVMGAISIILFFAPFDLAPGGVTGIAIVLNELLETPIGLVVLLLNIPIQIAAYRILPGGWRRIIRTIYVVLVYTLVLDLLALYFPADGVSDNLLLNAIFGGVLGGIGGGLIYRTGGTMGGTSTVALMLQSKRGTPMSTTFLYTDALIIVVASIVFGGIEPGLYAAVALFITGLATDYVMEGPSVIRTAVIITNHPDEVSQAILHGLNRGVTAWQAKGMYSGQEHWMLYVSVSRSQMIEVSQLVLKTDPTAFVVIGQGHAAYGEGFRPMPANRILDG